MGDRFLPRCTTQDFSFNFDPRETVQSLRPRNQEIPRAPRAYHAATSRFGCYGQTPMPPFLRENAMEFERRTPLASEQGTAAPNRQIHSVSRVDQAFQLQSERMQSGRRADVSQQVFHVIVPSSQAASV